MSIISTNERDRGREPSAFFECIPFIDWTGDLEVVAKTTETILRELANNKELFRALLERVPKTEELWIKCEEDVVEDKIVLWDDITKNIRIRLRMSTKPQERLAHSHRFSFTNLVLRGKYIHWLYKPLTLFDEYTNLDDVQEVMMHEDRAGDCFTIHHETLHSTPFCELHTISLVLRGNPLKERAPVMFKEARGRNEATKKISGQDFEPSSASVGDMFWRIGEDQESEQRRNERRMSLERFDYWLSKLTEYGVI